MDKRSGGSMDKGSVDCGNTGMMKTSKAKVSRSQDGRISLSICVSRGSSISCSNQTQNSKKLKKNINLLIIIS
jgi:hypothetical protein